MRRLVATLAVALLLVTAGCSGFLGDDSKQGFTATPVDVPTDEPTATPTEIVPGIGEEGVFDAERVVAAHEAALDEQSATVRIAESERQPGGQAGEDTELQESTWAYVGADRDRFHVIKHSGSALRIEERRFVEYASNETAVYRLDKAERYKTRKLDTARPEAVGTMAQAELLRVLLSSLEIGRPSPLRSSNGTEYRIRATAFADNATFEKWAGAENVSDVFFNANVTEDGFIRSFQLRYVVSKPDGNHVFETHVSYHDVGNTTVSEPLWWGEDQWLVGEDGGGEAAIATASAAALENQSMFLYRTTDVRENTSRLQSNVATERVSGQLGANPGHYRTTVYSTTSTEQIEYEAWANGTRRFERHRSGQAESYELVTDESGTPVDPASARRVNPLSQAETETLLTSVTFDNISVYTGMVQGSENRLMYVLRSGSIADRDAFEALTGHRNVSNLSVGVGVSRTGLVTGYSVEYSIRQNDTTNYVTQYYSVSEIGATTVERPSWVETALNASGDATPESAS